MPSHKIFAGLLILLLAAIAPTLLIHAGAPSALEESTPVEISLEPFLSGLDNPVNLIANGVVGDERLFVVERLGKIRVVKPDGTIRATPFLDISDRVETIAGKAGLYGLAFDPDYATNGIFYVHYIHRDGDALIARLSRFQVSADPNVADVSSENILLTVDKPVADHYAGDIHFGPDGYLYFPQGDGGAAVISNRPQSLTTMLGKMTRINVRNEVGEGTAACKGQGSGDYSIPLSNPFIGSPTACDEIWATGLRNPWRFSFDRLDGSLYLSDVGQALWDELNFTPAGSGGGQNYGWPCYEAKQVFETDHWLERGCDAGATFTLPVIDHDISGSDCSIIGGYAYRGSRFPELAGHYFMADYCSGHIRDAVRDGDQWTVTLQDVVAPMGVVSFGEGNDGELYVVNMKTNTIQRLVGEGGPTEATPTPVPTPSPTPAPGSQVELLISSNANGNVQGVVYADEDILRRDPATNTWSLWLDGSDVGLAATDVDALAVRDDGRLLISVDTPVTLPTLGKVDDSDLLLFAPTSLGPNTAGAFTLFLDGSSFGLTAEGEDIDAVTFNADGDLLISTTGTTKASGVTAADEDLVLIPLSAAGQPTANWSLGFDGSDVGLRDATEDINGAAIDSADGGLWLSTLGKFAVPGAKGRPTDLFSCTTVVWGANTSCPGDFDLGWQGSQFGLIKGKIDAIAIVGPGGG